MPADWTRWTSRAAEAYRDLEAKGVLQIVFPQRRRVYDCRCEATMHDAFLRASSKRDASEIAFCGPTDANWGGRTLP